MQGRATRPELLGDEGVRPEQDPATVHRQDIVGLRVLVGGALAQLSHSVSEGFDTTVEKEDRGDDDNHNNQNDGKIGDLPHCHCLGLLGFFTAVDFI